MIAIAALACHRRRWLLVALLAALALVPAGAGTPPPALGDVAVASFGSMAADTSVPGTSGQWISTGPMTASTADAGFATAVLPAFASVVLLDGGNVGAITATVTPVNRGAGALADALSGRALLAVAGSAEASDAWLVATGSGSRSAALTPERSGGPGSVVLTEGAALGGDRRARSAQFEHRPRTIHASIQPRVRPG